MIIVSVKPTGKSYKVFTTFQQAKRSLATSDIMNLLKVTLKTATT